MRASGSAASRMEDWLAALRSQVGGGSSADLYRAAAEGRLDEAALLWAAATSLGIIGPLPSPEQRSPPAAQPPPPAEPWLPPELERAASSALPPPSAAPVAAAAPDAAPAPASSPGRRRPLRSAALAASEAWGTLKPEARSPQRPRSNPVAVVPATPAAVAGADLRTPVQRPLAGPPGAAPSSGLVRKRSLEELLNSAEGEQAPLAARPPQRPPLPPAAGQRRSPTAPAAGAVRPGSTASSGGRGRPSPAVAAAAAAEPALLYHEQRLQYTVQRTFAPQVSCCCWFGWQQAPAAGWEHQLTAGLDSAARLREPSPPPSHPLAFRSMRGTWRSECRWRRACRRAGRLPPWCGCARGSAACCAGAWATCCARSGLQSAPWRR